MTARTKRLAVVLVAAVLFLVGTYYPSMKREAPTPYPPVRVTKLLESDVIIREDLRGFSMDLDIVGDQIILVDAMADSLVALFDLDGTPAGRYLTKGEGPREVKKATALHVRNDTVFVHDQGRGRVVKFKLGADFSETEITEDPILGVVPYEVTPYKDGYLLSEGVHAMFSRWQETGIDTVGDMPPLLRKVKKEFRGGNRALRIMAVHPTEDLVAVAFLGTGELAIANTDGDLLNVVRPYNYKMETRKAVVMPEALTYQSLSATDTAIFALFVGERLEEAFVDRYPDARHVHMYDWSGNLLRIFELSHPALDVAVKDDALYTVGFEPYPEVRRYQIPPPIVCEQDPEIADDLVSIETSSGDSFEEYLKETSQ